MKRLAIIPASGGSKRIPNKNIRDFCGQPMITHVLSAARACGLFNTVHVSTESESIRDVAAQFGFPPDFPRPAELADDHTPIMPVLRYAVQEYANRGVHFDEVWLLMACAPLIDAKDLSSAATLFQQAGSEQPLLVVSEYPAPIEWACSRSENGALTPPCRLACSRCARRTWRSVISTPVASRCFPPRECWSHRAPVPTTASSATCCPRARPSTSTTRTTGSWQNLYGVPVMSIQPNK